MLRRLLIFAPLALCLALWITSYFHLFLYNHIFSASTPRTGRYTHSQIGIGNGYVSLFYSSTDGGDHPADWMFEKSFLGFYLDLFHVSPSYGFEVIQCRAPLWFPTLLSALPALLLWWKSKRKPPAAFPIEPHPPA